MKSRLHIHVSSRDGITYLRNSFSMQPFKIADITEHKNSSQLRLMLMSSSPGILDQDDYSISIDLDEGTDTILETQSYQRLFQMKQGAQQQLEVRMKASSSFEFIPHPSVPHQSSIFVAKNKIYLSPDCSLIWGEVLTCGRKLNGEIFRFSKYQSVTEIFLLNKLIVKENLFIAPTVFDVLALGQLEGYSHQATLMCIGSDYESETIVNSIHELLTCEKDICLGVSALENGCIVRLLGYHAEQLHNCLKNVSLLLKDLRQQSRLTQKLTHAG